MPYAGLLFSLPLLVAIACGDDEQRGVDEAREAGGPQPSPALDGAAGTNGDSGGLDGAGGAEPEPPKAVGDPCRGVPLPPDKHYVPAGMCARLVGQGGRAMRQMTFAPNGDLWVTSRDGYIKIFRDANGNGVYEPEEVHTWESMLTIGNNVHIDVVGGFVYSGSPAGVVRWPYDPAAVAPVASPQPVVVGQPSDGHPLHTVHVYDNYLYVVSGSEGDASNPMAPAYDTTRSLLRRFPLASFVPGAPFPWQAGENVTVGLRNMVGFTRSASGRMYGVVNGLDLARSGGVDLHEDNPGEQVVELGMGRSYGFPFCFTAQRAVINGALIPVGQQLIYDSWSSVHDNAWCALNSMKPTTFVQAHSAPLEILFFERQPKGVLPERWRGGAFVSLHGSHARTTPTGYKIVWIPFDKSGNSPMPTSTMTDTAFPHEVVFGGGSVNTGAPKDGPWLWTSGSLFDDVRPVGLAIHPVDGALYVSTDSAGFIYRVGMTQ